MALQPDRTFVRIISMDIETDTPRDPLRAEIIMGKITRNPDGDSLYPDREVLQGKTPSGEPRMVWAADTIAVENGQLPTNLGETTVVQHSFGNTIVEVGLQRTDRGLRVASAQRVTPLTQ